jgi:hypothetical protein
MKSAFTYFKKNSEEYISSSDTLDTLSSMGTESSTSNHPSPLRMEAIISRDFLNEENLVYSEVSSEGESDISENDDMNFSMIFGEGPSIPSPYGGLSQSPRPRGASEESLDSTEPPSNKDNTPGSPKSTAVSMSPPDNNNTYLSSYGKYRSKNHETESERYQELIQSISNDLPEPLQADPDELNLRDLIYGPNHVFENEVIGLANLFGYSI